jgi:hypothetical protein
MTLAINGLQNVRQNDTIEVPPVDTGNTSYHGTMEVDPSHIFGDTPTWAFVLILCESLLVLAIFVGCFAIVMVIIIRTRKARQLANQVELESLK